MHFTVCGVKSIVYVLLLRVCCVRAAKDKKNGLLKKQNRGYVSMKRKTVQKAGAVSAAVVYDIRVFVRDGKGKTESKTLQLTVTK